MSSAGVNPGKLWSLWDMLEFKFDEIASGLSVIAQVKQYFAILLRRDTDSKMPEACQHNFPERDIDDWHHAFESLHKKVIELELPSTAVSCQRLIDCLSEIKVNCPRVAAEAPFEHGPVLWVAIKHTQIERVYSRLTETHSRLCDELSSRLFLSIEPTAAELYTEKDAFGIKSQFGAATFDIDEAAKALALERYSAAVFHLMRVMELGLRAVHGCLGINVVLQGNERNWGNILGRIRDNIRGRGGPTKWPEHDYFQSIYAFLNAVKDAWRNPTMHVEKKYLPDEAKELFSAVKAFMKNVASRMDENGDPKV